MLTVQRPHIASAYLTDISPEEWAFVLPYLAASGKEPVCSDQALRMIFNAVRYWLRTGIQRSLLPHDLPEWTTVQEQLEAWSTAHCFASLMKDLDLLLHASREGNKLRDLLPSAATRNRPQEHVRMLAHSLAKMSAGSIQVRLDEETNKEPRRKADTKNIVSLEVLYLPGSLRGYVLFPAVWLELPPSEMKSRLEEMIADYIRWPHLVDRETYSLRNFPSSEPLPVSCRPIFPNENL